MKQAVVLAGGKGTRLQGVLGNLPKALVDIGGMPLLGHQLQLLQTHGFDEALLLVSHGADSIRHWLSTADQSKLPVRLIVDESPLGTAGAVLAALPHLAPEFMLLYGDTMLGVDLTRFWKWHEADPTAAASIFVHPNDHPQDSDLVEQDDEGNVLAFHPYPHPSGVWLPNLVNAALYIVRRDCLLPWQSAAPPLDFGKDIFPQMLKVGLKLRSYASPEYIKDSGTPSRLERVRLAYANGTVARAALSHPQRAVFIDRDGTLNADVGYVRSAEELKVFPFVGAALRRLNDNEWRSVVITNQPVVARGDVDLTTLRRIHARLDSEVALDHAYFDRLYYCPHHPDAGFRGEVPALKVVCNCRKPAPGLILKAASDLNIDLAESWFIGDSSADLGAAENAGVSSILVETGSSGLDDRYPYEAGFTRPDFGSAVDFIIDDYPRIAAASKPILASIHSGEDWFVGGLARSGKSTFASTLLRELRRQGHVAVVIQLDRWILSSADRPPGFFGRFDMASLTAVLEHAAKRATAPVTIEMPTYSRRQQQRLDQVRTLTLPMNATVIWEGVVALELARLRNNHKTIQVGTNEVRRRERFHHYDARRGISAEASETAWTSRQMDEHPLVTALGAIATHRIQLDDHITSLPRKAITK